MKLACTNIAQVRAEIRQAIGMGARPFELLLFRMADGRGKLFALAPFCHRYVEHYPDMVAELRDRLENELASPRDMLCVRIDGPGKWTIGLLERRKKTARSMPKNLRLH